MTVKSLLSGSPLHDMTRFLINCADAHVRRGIQEQAINVYYDRLAEKLKGISVKSFGKI
jgi:hypothetical protein